MKKHKLLLTLALCVMLSSFAYANDAQEQYERGANYDNEGNYSDAIKYYRIAAEQDLPEAQFKLGVFYANGLGVKKNDSEAVKWYLKAADHGLSAAYYNLGIMYLKGYKTALGWFVKASEMGDDDADMNIATMYHKGMGVKQSEREAVKWYRKAAERGNIEGIYFLGCAYGNGEGVKQDFDEAHRLFTMAATENYAPAQHDLGMMYLLVADDSEQAIEWLRKAAQQGYELSQKKLTELGQDW